MKKVAISMLATVALMQAQELPYKVFVETFSNANDPAVNVTYNEVKDALKDYDGISVLKRPSGKFHVVVVETVMKEDKFNKLFSKIKSMPQHGDAFWLPAPELLKKGTEPKATKEKVAKKAPAQKVQETQEVLSEGDVRKVDTEAATAPRNSADSKAISLESAIDKTLKTHPSIQQQIFNYMEIGKDLDISERGYYPTLDFTGTIGIGRSKETTDTSKGDWQNLTSKTAELRLVQNLYDGGVITNNVSQSKSRMNNASYLVLERADRTSLSTVDAYLNVIKEKTLLDLSAENILALEDIYDQIKQRTESGFGRMSEKQQAASRLTLAQSNFIAQQNAYDDALATFKKQTGLSVDAEQLEYPIFTHILPSDIATFRKKAMMCNPSVRAEQANVELAREIYKGANAAYYPKLDLEAYASINDQDYEDDSDDDRIDSYGALLRFRYNLFNKGIDMVTKEKRQVGIQKEEQVLEKIKQDLDESLKFSWQSYVLNNKKLGYLADHARFSKETLDSYKEEFKIGRRELINVLDAENEYYNSQKEMVSAERDLLYAKYRILDNMGLITDSFEPGFGKKYVKDACSVESNL